jgi:protein-S-isoprenylcysteine O-methyltransferase Ste14
MVLRIIALLLFLFWGLYWMIEQERTYRKRPLTQQVPMPFRISSMIGLRLLFLLIALQLLGIDILSMDTKLIFYQAVGFALILIGMAISVAARIVLSTNWANGYEYQIKKGQELVTKGIYKFIRHPIYTGMVISFIGAEMVASSWLWISFIALFVPAFLQAKREEKILSKHFGKAYMDYMKTSKMLIPFVW